MTTDPNHERAQEHNPDSLSPEQYGAPEFRLLLKGERQAATDTWWGGDRNWHKNVPSDHGKEVESTFTYRRRVAPAPAECEGKEGIEPAQVIARLNHELANVLKVNEDQSARIASLERRVEELTEENAIIQRNAAGAVENEQERWQDGLDALFARLIPDANLDGGGCDSGDPLDFSLSEISQAIQHVETKAESELSQLRATVAQITAERDEAMAERDKVMFDYEHDTRVLLFGEKWKELQSLRAQLAASERWKPIETAPKDGTKILGWSREYGQRETYMRHYQKGSPGFAAFEQGKGPSEVGWDWPEPKNNWSLTWNPTHWQPLPQPPAPETL